MQIPLLVGNFIAFVHEDWEPPLIGQVLAVNELDVLVHWWVQIRYSLWKPCFQSESPWTENIPIKDIVHKFKWEDACLWKNEESLTICNSSCVRRIPVT